MPGSLTSLTCITDISDLTPAHFSLYLLLPLALSSANSHIFLQQYYMLAFSQSILGFPGGPSGKESVHRYRRHKRHRFDSWVRKIPWRRKWQSALVFLLGESPGQRGAWQVIVHRITELDMAEVT